MTLDQATIDDITAATAAAVLEDVDYHMEDWKRNRGRRPAPPLSSTGAPGSDLGFDLLPYIADAVQAVWDWCLRNREALALSAIPTALFGAIFHIMSERAKGRGMSKEEIEALVKAMVPEILEQLRIQGLLSPASGSEPDRKAPDGK